MRVQDGSELGVDRNAPDRPGELRQRQRQRLLAGAERFRVLDDDQSEHRARPHDPLPGRQRRLVLRLGSAALGCDSAFVFFFSFTDLSRSPVD